MAETEPAAWERDLMVQQAAVSGESRAEQIAQAFHEAYERHAQQTDQDVIKPWAEVAEHYRAMLIAAIQVLLDDGVITGGSVTRERTDEERIRDAMAEAQDHPGRIVTR